MSDPRFEPRAYLRIPSTFGRRPSDQQRWLLLHGIFAAGLDERFLPAATIHNDLVYQIHRRRDWEEMTTAELAERAGMTLSRMRRLLRGEAILRLEDVVIIGGVVKCDVSVRFIERPAEVARSSARKS